MNSIDFGEVQQYAIVRLTHVGMLSDKLKKLIDQDLQSQQQELESLNRHDLLKEPDLMLEAAKEGYKTIGGYKQLEKKEPERVHRMYLQSHLQMEKHRRTIELELSQQVYPNLTWSSLVLISMALFEEVITLICDYLSQTRGYRIKMNDLRGRSALHRCKMFLTKVVEIEFDFGASPHWQKVNGHQTVRNLIVHNSGVLDNSSQADAVRKFVDGGNTSLSITDGGLAIEREYIYEVIDDAQNWMLELFDAIKKDEIF